ncbi:MAG: twin-arginine translocation signal domain-containing protein [Candidatus Dormibacteraeota bacterium]|nr:twin-arginine translocation signal domain-containing protein [Candidatus Dormibacteraeota bacterium]
MRGAFHGGFSRRDFLKVTGAAGATLLIPNSVLRAADVLAATSPIRAAGSLPFPGRPPGHPQPDLAPALANIDHIIMLMMENHSFDNYFGMLPYQVPALNGNVDGWPSLGRGGIPNTAVPQADSQGVVHTPFPMPNGCQPGAVSQSWDASHQAYDQKKMDGFCIGSSPAALGYWDQSLLPFYYSLASNFVVCDRYFCSTLCQTYPNRVFMMAATACGLTATQTPPPSVTPVNGHIFERLDAYNISWMDLYAELPSPGLFGATYAAQEEALGKLVFAGPTNDDLVTAFSLLCQANNLPSVMLLEPNYEYGSEENPQNVQTGQTFVQGIVNALMNSPAWSNTLLIYTYDEHGGYYDHVVPPSALNLNPGDGTSPSQPPVTSTYGDDYTVLGFRVPTVIVSPWIKLGFVSHTVYDHTSWLATIEKKWNLPALTNRDAQANPLDDCLVSSGPAPLATPPMLQSARHSTEADSVACEEDGGQDPLALPEAPSTALLAAAGVAAGAGALALRQRIRTPQ